MKAAAACAGSEPPTPKMGLEKRSPSPRPSPPGEGEARTVPGIFTPFGVKSSAATELTKKSWLRSDRLLDFPQLLGLRFARVILVERVTAADQAVARRGGAIAERAADGFLFQRALLHCVGDNRGIGQRHAAQADQVRPAVADDELCNVRQILLQVTVGGAHDYQIELRRNVETLKR